MRISRESRSLTASPHIKMSRYLHLAILVLQVLHSHQRNFPRPGSASSDDLMRRSAPGSQVRLLSSHSPQSSLDFLISKNCIHQVELLQCQRYSFDFTFQPSDHGGESSPGYRHGNITGDGNQNLLGIHSKYATISDLRP